MAPPSRRRAMPRLETGLRRARQKSGYTQGELAERAGISRQTLSILESGRGQPSTMVALRLAHVLRCRVEELFWLREEGGELRAELAGPGERRHLPSKRVLVGSVAGRWVAHRLRRQDPLGLTTAADALLSRAPRDGEPARLFALRPVEALQANVLVTGRCTIQRSNYAALRETVAAAHALGLDRISFLAAADSAVSPCISPSASISGWFCFRIAVARRILREESVS